MTSWFRSVFYHSLCVSHEFCFFFQFSFFSCFFLTHTALFCFLILHVSFKSKHLAGSNQRLVLRMPLDLVLPREAPKGTSRPSILNPLSWFLRNGAPGENISFQFTFVCNLSSFSFSFLSSFWLCAFPLSFLPFISIPFPLLLTSSRFPVSFSCFPPILFLEFLLPL